MPGFNNGVVWADNVRFDGTGYPGAITTDGQLLIGSTASPNIRVGSITAGSNIAITPGAGTITTALKTSISQPNTNATGTEGVYSLGGNPFLHNYGSAGAGSVNTFVGNNVGNLTNTSFYTTIIGGDSAKLLTTGNYNTIVGSVSALALTTGQKNTVVGAYNFLDCSSGESNNIFGYSAGAVLTTGLANCFFGDHAGYYCATAGYNAFIGHYSGEKMIGGNNVGIGPMACRGGDSTTSTGAYNVAVGANSLESVTTGHENSAIGFLSLGKVTTGAGNCSIGTGSLDKADTGNYNVCCGYLSGTNYTGAESSNIIIQNYGVVGESNTIRIGTQGAGNLQENRCFIAGITGVTVSNTALVTLDTTTGQLGTKTISNLPTWTVINADQPAAVGAGYFCNKVGLLSLSLPAASAVGDVIEVSNINTAVGTAITQVAGQQIYYGSLSTTLGAGGSLTSIAVGDSLKIVCRVANTFWQVVSSVGSWTVV